MVTSRSRYGDVRGQREHGGHRERALDVAEDHHVLPAHRHPLAPSSAQTREAAVDRDRAPGVQRDEREGDRPGLAHQQVASICMPTSRNSRTLTPKPRLPEALEREHARRLEGARAVPDSEAGDHDRDHRRAAEVARRAATSRTPGRPRRGSPSGGRASAGAPARRPRRTTAPTARRRPSRGPARGRSSRRSAKPCATTVAVRLTRTSAVPSLKRLSPSMIAARRCGTRTLRNASSTLTVSVMESRAPSSSAIGEREAERQVATAAVASERDRDAGERQRQDRPAALRRLSASAKSAPSKTSIGRNTSSTTAGSSGVWAARSSARAAGRRRRARRCRERRCASRRWRPRRRRRGRAAAARDIHAWLLARRPFRLTRGTGGRR